MESSAAPARSTKLAGGLFIAGSLLGAVGNALHPHVADPDSAAVVRSIAENGAWVAIHLAIILAILMVTGGLVGLADQLRGTPGHDLARLGIAAALIGGAVVTVSTSIDGFAMKALALSAGKATGSDAATGLQVATAARSVDFAIWSIGMLVFFGISFACLGAAVVASRRMPARYGWIAIVGALGSTVAALLQITSAGELQDAESLFLASSLLLTIWAFALGVRMWRGSPGHGPVGSPSAVAPTGQVV